MSLQSHIEALRQPLRVAADDGFRGIDRVTGLGDTLRAACDRVLATAPAEVAESFRAWRKVLAAFDQLDRDDQAVEVARGLRLCQSAGGRARPQRAPVAASAGLLAQPTVVLPGIGPAMAERLAERGIETVEDLIWLVPRRYDDARRMLPLSQALAASPGERVTTGGEVASARFNRRGRVRWLDVRLAEPGGAGTLAIRWFNAFPNMAQRYPRGARVVVSGRLQQRGAGAEMANPDVLSVVTPDGASRAAQAAIIPRYADIPGVPAGTLRKACLAAVERGAGQLIDGVPPDIAERVGLAPLREAIVGLHQPPESLSIDEAAALDQGRGAWHRRLAFDELFCLGLVVAERRRRRRADVAVACPDDGRAPAELGRALPFALTGAQERAVAVLTSDLAGEQPMNRLLQGDVGSGKTAVAFAAARQVVRAGLQVAIMAPTEILAEQHFATFSTWAAALGLEARLLTASTPRPVRASMLSLLEAGRIDLVIGTHALLAEGVVFERLGLVIIDEQHRFGVAQRVRLRQKSGQGAPHLLVMTATPIPRTLALTAYGDLDVTVIDEMPPGRTPAQTRVLSGPAGRKRALAHLQQRVAAGERGFVVCPLVEPSLEDEVRAAWADATSVAAELAPLFNGRVGLLHGRMAQDQRDEVMARFRDGDLDVLCATTVIEVGVDVPQATVMLIEDADRFGLAQLHQLRGRVGRGGGSSWCVLLTRGRKTPDGARRLEVMAETTDGFRIAEEDLRLRGPGELLGTRQAGLPKLRFGDLIEHAELLALARSEADSLLAADPELAAHPDTRRVLEQRTRGLEVYGAEGG